MVKKGVWVFLLTTMIAGLFLTKSSYAEYGDIVLKNKLESMKKQG